MVQLVKNVNLLVGIPVRYEGFQNFAKIFPLKCLFISLFLAKLHAHWIIFFNKSGVRFVLSVVQTISNESIIIQLLLNEKYDPTAIKNVLEELKNNQ